MPRLVSSRPVSRAVLPVPQAGGYRQCVPTLTSPCPPIMMPPPPPLPQPMMIPQFPMPQVSNQLVQLNFLHAKTSTLKGYKIPSNSNSSFYLLINFKSEKLTEITLACEVS